MAKIVERWKRLSPELQSIVRIAAALMFMSAGTMKLFSIPSPPRGFSLELFSELGLAGFLEVFGGALILVGFFTRPVAFILSGEMAVAYFQVHFAQGYWPTLNGGQPAVFYCFFWLYLSAAGAGAWSIDALREKRCASSREAL